MKTNRILLLGSLALALLSCKKKEEVKNPWEFEIDKIDIKDSTKLLMSITDEANPLNDNTKGNELFMITTSGKVVKRTLNKTSGEDVSDMMRPGVIANATPKYMLLTFSRTDASASEGYLVDKTTGQMNLLGDNYNIPTYENFSTLRNDLVCKTVGNNLYYANRTPMTNQQIIKLDCNTLAKTALTSDTIEYITSFDVDNNGNIICDVRGISGKRWMIGFNDKFSQKLPNISLSYWVANDGKFRNSSLDNKLEKLEFDNVNKKIEITKEIDLQGLSITTERNKSYIVYLNDKTHILSDNKLLEYYPVEKKIKQITSVPLISTKWADHSKALGHLYVAGESASGQETIFNIDLSNYSYKTYPEAGKYSFYEIEAFEDGTIYATAKRKSDGKNVVLKFAPDGTETVLYDQLGTKKGVWLEKVTEFVND